MMLKPWRLGARAVIGKVQAFLDNRVDVDRPMIARALRANAAAYS